MYVIPADGLKVPDPARLGDPNELYFLPAEGRDVGDADWIYWTRRVKDGDCTVGEPPAPAPAPAPAPDA